MKVRSLKFLILMIVYASTQILAKNIPKEAFPNHQRINKFIRTLNYDPHKVLTYKGEKVWLPSRSKGSSDSEGNFVVRRLEKKSIQSNDLNLGVIESMREHVFPGAILQANDELLKNNPTMVVVDRAPIKYTVGLQGLKGHDSSFRTIPEFSNYFPNHQRILKTWFEKYPKDHVIPAQFIVDKSSARSQEQLTVKFGLDASIISSKIDFEYIEKNEKLVYVYKFQQVFYTVSVDPPKEPARLFTPQVRMKDLGLYVNDANPPVLVDSVTYGRIIYVIVETTSTDSNAKLALESLFSEDLSLNGNVNIGYQFKNLTIHASVLGGNINEISLVNAMDFTEVDRVIIDHANFTRNDPGVPIYYSAIFLKDNRVARVGAFTEYTDETREFLKAGSLRLEDYADCYTKWYVDWDEYNYGENGTKIFRHVTWEENGKWPHGSFTKYLHIPGNSENIHLKVMWAGLGAFVGRWNLLREVYNVPLLPDGRAFKVQSRDISEGGDPELIIHPNKDLKTLIY